MCGGWESRLSQTKPNWIEIRGGGWSSIKLFLKKIFGGQKFFLWGHWYPCFGLLVMSVRVARAQQARRCKPLGHSSSAHLSNFMTVVVWLRSDKNQNSKANMSIQHCFRHLCPKFGLSVQLSTVIKHKLLPVGFKLGVSFSPLHADDNHPVENKETSYRNCPVSKEQHDGKR